MVRIIVILLLYIGNIVLLVKTIEYLHIGNSKLSNNSTKNNILHTINIDKTNIMIIISKKRIYPQILYGYNTLEEVKYYKYLGINFNFYLK
jgi:hypothetical protein